MTGHAVSCMLRTADIATYENRNFISVLPLYTVNWI